MSKMMRNYLIGLSIAIVIYAAAVSWLTIRDIIVPAELIDTIILFILASATIFYAIRTSDIAEATKQQADASVKMAEETREQRYSESLPLLVPTIPDILPSEKLPYESIASGVRVKVIWCNVGKGIAINSRFSFWTAPTSTGKAHLFPPSESVTLEVGGKKPVDYNEILNDGQLRDIPEEYRPYLLAEYDDIYERKITTVQEFQIEEHNNYKTVFIGEIYFTINGRRLGEEVARHD